jgi:hypothetical protein
MEARQPEVASARVLEGSRDSFARLQAVATVVLSTAMARVAIATPLSSTAHLRAPFVWVTHVWLAAKS